MSAGGRTIDPLSPHPSAARVLAAVESARDEIVQLAADLVRIPSVNPPGAHYRDCADLMGARLDELGMETRQVVAEDRPEHSEAFPRVNVIGGRDGDAPGPTVHLNGHFDVVPAGDGWTVDPFGGLVREGRLYGRGSADMKAGIAAAIGAVAAVVRSGARWRGRLEVSGTGDEESGGFAGVAHLARAGFIAEDRTHHVIIPEPLDPERICVGHRGVWWFRLRLRGRTAHGSMPFAGVNAIEKAAGLIERLRVSVGGSLEHRHTAMPVEPAQARRGTLNVNAILGGQAGADLQTPCVADRCEIVFDRRFLLEEGLDRVRAEIDEVLHAAAAVDPDLEVEIDDLMVVHPVQTPADSPLVAALSNGIRRVLACEPTLVASPGTYDHKHVTRIGGVEDCVAYGPGRLEQAHQPDEWCGINDMIAASQVMALAILELIGEP